eukprot:GFKZ01008998.1.p1 GENE.GFKZ01008998.1~~GFKZ01008998.1.p1  ORF type:complete len:873 (+),score=157.50 GFKZ01008998.1:381-2999(+)
MDIRKYLKKNPTSKKPPSSSKKSQPPPVTPTRSSRRLKASSSSPAPSRQRDNQNAKVLDSIDDDDLEDDFQPRRKRRSKTPKIQEVDENDDPPDMNEPPKSGSAKKRARSNSSHADAGFGGGADIADPEPAPKKKKWIPRTDEPPNRGNKELPVGKPDCLAGKVFVISGVLDSLLREECTDLCKEYGARVVSGVSRKVTHGIVGTNAGESKMKKLKEYRIPSIDEDGLFDMIRSSLPKKTEGTGIDTGKDEDQIMEVEEVVPVIEEKVTRNAKRNPEGNHNVLQRPANVVTTLWVDKYRPVDCSQLVANPKAIKDLKSWLEMWKSKFLYGDGHTWKIRERGDKDHAAALLVGPPGIGKTTAAHVVCKELGFEPHEFNASDVRNKGGVQVLADTLMVASTISRFLTVSEPGGGKKKKYEASAYPEGQVLIMDEVDGMSGGDRGGSQELIKMIKTSKVPIICIANDDSSSNMRSLSGNCFKIRFRRPMISQSTKRLAEIARREGYRQLQDQTLAKLAEGCNGDIRQMINLLQTWRVSSTSLSFGQVKKRLGVEGKTVIHKSIFDLARGFFTPGMDGSQNSLIARTENYFADSDLMPLFIQENYINTVAASSSLEHLADAAESIAEGDLCNSIVRREQRWDLMPAAAVMSAIRPGSLLAGGMGQQPLFPSYLGNLSKANKWKRIVLGLEMKVKAVPQTTSGSLRSFRLDYIPAMTTCLATPLIRDGAGGVDEVIEKLDSYFLERDPDWTEVLEAGVYGKGRSPLENIASSAKTALTRAYNLSDHKRSTVTGLRVGVKQSGTDFAKTSRKASEEGGDVGTVDDDPLEKEGGEDEEDQVEDVVAEFGVTKKKRGKAKAKSSNARSGKSRGGRSRRKK